MNDSEIVKKDNNNEHENIDESGLIEVSILENLIKHAISPFTESKRIQAVERTKQIEIITKEKTKIFYRSSYIAGGIVLLAVIALFLGKDEITEKIILSIFSFLGGIGFGKSDFKFDEKNKN